MADLKHYSSSDLPSDLTAQIKTYFLMMLVDEGDEDEAQFEDPFMTDKIREHFVAVEGDVLLSHADVSERMITHQGETYRLRGVGEVMTHPNFRHKGHGHRVIAAATDYIRSTDADIGMLFTMPELESFYGSSGWVTVNTQGITFGDPAQPRFDDAYVMMLFLSDKAKAHHADFEQGPIYVGRLMW